MKKLLDAPHHVQPDGTLVLHDLEPGSDVQVVVYQPSKSDEKVDPTKCRVTLRNYEEPFEPAATPDLKHKPIDPETRKRALEQLNRGFDLGGRPLTREEIYDR